MKRTHRPRVLRLLLLALTACALLGVALPAAAQSRARFDPAKHLDAWDAAYLSDYSDLYDFQPYEDAAGDSMSADQIERLRELWRAERVRVLQEIERIETDPSAATTYRLRRKLRRHPHFSQLELEFVEGEAPFLFIVQSPPKETSGYAQRVAASFGPWLRALNERFERELARPLGLERQSGAEVLPVVVLASKGSFDDYLRAVWGATDPSLLAFFETRLSLLVLHNARPGARGASPQVKRHDDLREAARFLWQVHGVRRDDMLGPFWLQVGVANALAGHDGKDPAALRSATYTPEHVRVLLTALRQDEPRTLYWRSLDELQRIGDWGDPVALANARAKAAGIDAARVAAPFSKYAFTQQSGALAHYLLYGAGGAHRERFVALIGDTLRGKVTPRAFEELFAELAAARADLELVRHLFAQHRLSYPQEDLPDAELARVIAELNATPAATAGGAPAANAPALPFAAAFAGEDARFALALARVRSGDAEAGRELLVALRAGATGATRDRLAIELERVEAWIELRDRFLTHLAANDARLSVDHHDEKLVAKVEGFADGELRLGKNRRELVTVAATELDPLELARAMGSDKAGFEPSWARGYPYVLDGGKAWKRLMTSDDAASSLLREHAEGDYPARADAIEAAAALAALADSRPPVNSIEAQLRLDQVAALCGRSDVPFVALARPGLVELARGALAVQFGEQGLEALLNTEVETLPDGRLRLSYDFEEERQALDWPVADAAREGWQASNLRPMRTNDNRFVWQDGALVAYGHVARRHVLELEGEMRLRCRWSSLEVREHTTEGAYNFLAALCARSGSWAGILNGLAIDMRDKAHGDWRQDPEDAQVDTFFNTAYDSELFHDGARTIRMKRDENTIAELDCGELPAAGGVLLWTFTDHPTSFLELELEGRPTAASLTALGEGWIAERLAELGLEDDAGR